MCAPPAGSGESVLTTTIDGLWLLQVLSGTEVLAPELGLRPYLPSVETTAMALDHPMAAELREVGVITAGGEVDSTVLDWLTVLSRRDVALLMYVQTPSHDVDRVLVARFAQWWVALERCGGMVRLSGVGVATNEQSAATLLRIQIERLCGAMAPATVRPATLDIAQLLKTVGAGENLRAFLNASNLDSGQINTLTLAADPERSAQASLVAIQSGMSGAPVIDSGTVTVIDTPSGR
ncbi:MAG: ESX secretion-associated protein EspG, partial [Mycobacterium sp.]|nr:ESX secretion-associated protein EspG [Mycobacterium sp.]